MDAMEQPTCGKGLAENAKLPATLGHVLAAMAENLAMHMKALDLSDLDSVPEYEAYQRLVGQLQQVANQLQSTAEEMAGYHDLPMGKHDEVAMTQPEIRLAFEKFLKHKQDLLALLQQTTERDRQLLEMMRAPDQLSDR